MKQTLEEAKREYIEKYVSRNEYASFGKAFEAGAEWQANQSLWISIKEEKPVQNKVVLVNRNGNHFAGYLSYAMGDWWWDTTVLSGMESHLMSDDDLWMDIPKFHE